jgi:hypothetical protein
MYEEIDFLKEVLSVPTVTGDEKRMIQYLQNWLTENSIEHFTDFKGNVYATKGKIEEGEYFPCVVSHTDTVHQIDTINIREEILSNYYREPKLSLKAYNDEGEPTGIGGDDKCGVFACLKLLKELPVLKAAFFVSEENGCHGSRAADEKFFENVGYAIQFDAPESYMVSEYLMGIPMFSRDDEFFKTCDNVLTENLNMVSYKYHPYTDIYALRTKFDFSCINISIGYYNYHTRNEYVVIEDTINGLKMGKEMINRLGYQKFHIPQEKGRYVI